MEEKTYFDFTGEEITVSTDKDGHIIVNGEASVPFAIGSMVVIFEQVANSIGENKALAVFLSMYSDHVGHKPDAVVYHEGEKIFPNRIIDDELEVDKKKE